MTDHTYAGYTAGQIRAAAASGLWSQFVNVAQPGTVLALLDRIAKLERRADAAEGWRQAETGRADELQENVYRDRDEIAGLRARIADLEPDAARWAAIIRVLVGSSADATRAQPAE